MAIEELEEPNSMLHPPFPLTPPILEWLIITSNSKSNFSEHSVQPCAGDDKEVEP